MAAKKPEPTIETHIVIKAGYDRALALPARLASEVLPHLRMLTYSYSDGYSKSEDSLEIILLDSEKMTAIEVKSLLTGETK